MGSVAGTVPAATRSFWSISTVPHLPGDRKKRTWLWTAPARHPACMSVNEVLTHQHMHIAARTSTHVCRGPTEGYQLEVSTEGQQVGNKNRLYQCCSPCTMPPPAGLTGLSTRPRVYRVYRVEGVNGDGMRREHALCDTMLSACWPNSTLRATEPATDA
jgi:hypothetical protein